MLSGALRVFFFHLLVNTSRLKENAGYRRKQTNSSAVIGVLLGNEAFVDFCLQLPVQIRDRNSINMQEGKIITIHNSTEAYIMITKPFTLQPAAKTQQQTAAVYNPQRFDKEKAQLTLVGFLSWLRNVGFLITQLEFDLKGDLSC